MWRNGDKPGPGDAEGRCHGEGTMSFISQDNDGDCELIGILECRFEHGVLDGDSVYTNVGEKSKGPITYRMGTVLHSGNMMPLSGQELIDVEELETGVADLQEKKIMNMLMRMIDQNDKLKKMPNT